MTPHNPDNRKRERGTEVLRDETGPPVVNPSIAVLPVEQWRARS